MPPMCRGARQAARVYDRATATVTLRTHAQIAALFDGWDPLWRPDGKPPRPKDLARVWGYGAVARR